MGGLTSWPTAHDYDEAIQNPAENFNDADLREGALSSTIAGNFARVYRVETKSGPRAVRCLLHDFSDYRRRYAAITNHLLSTPLPYFVGFQFLENGIRVREQWYPIVKMEWVDGTTFKDYIEQNISNPSEIAGLAERWIAMLRALRKNKIAHGDLQHENVRISEGEFLLLDYDGMFVPGLAEFTSHETGHRNYQHPGRSQKDFGIHLDNFSGWLIYLSLVALSVEPGLWRQFGKGDEHILFRKEDLEQPRLSRVFRSIEQLKDERIQKYLPLFRSFLTMGLTAIASPAEVIGVKPKKPETRRQAKPKRAWAPEVQLDLFAGTAAPPAPAPVAEIPEVLSPGMEPATFQFSRSCRRERVMIGFYGAFILTVLALTAGGAISFDEGVLLFLGGLAAIMASLTFSYVSLDEVRGKLQLWFTLEWRRRLGETVRYALVGCRRVITVLDGFEARAVQWLAECITGCGRREKKRVAEVKSALAAFTEELNARRAALTEAEFDETCAVLNELQIQHNGLLREGAFLVDVPAPQLEPKELQQLRSWRASVEELARKGPPVILPEADQAAIRTKYLIERQAVQESETFAVERAHRKIERIHASTKRLRELLDSWRQRRWTWSERCKQYLRFRIEYGNSWLEANQREMKACIAEMDRYREITLSRYLPRLFGFLPKM